MQPTTPRDRTGYGASRTIASPIAPRPRRGVATGTGSTINGLPETITYPGAGPFRVGDRVYARAFDSAGVIVGIGETAIVSARYAGIQGPLQSITKYEVELDDDASLRRIADRDGHLVAI